MLSRLDPPMVALQEEARALADRLAPLAVEADAMSTVHPEVLALLRDSGLMGLTVPARYGGRSEQVDPLAVCLVREVLMGVCSHADSLFALQGIGSFAITTGGTEAQRSRWLPGVASGQALAALALTEPVAGSDLRSITTNAVVGDDGTIELRGTKAFISNAGAAAFYTVLAREGSQLSTFLVPADADGLTTRPAPELAAAHVLGDVELDGVRLPPDARLGEPGRGLDLVLATLAVFRVSVAGAAVGLAQAALEEATRHAADREQFGRPLARLGPVAGLLADSWADVESARLVTYRAAELAREDPRAHLEHSSLAKLAATEACSRVVDRCVQVMGRWGLVRDSRIERCYRQSRPMRVYEGASEVLRLGIARQLVAEVG
jgi:acyl-CoA dehydrogenase